MNDFLQNLRGSSQKEKRTPKTRRSFDHGNQYNAAPGFQSHGNYQGARASNVKKPATRATLHTHMTGGDHQPPHLSMEPADIMVELMDIYTKNQDLLINVQERRVKVEERKAIALEKIAEYIRVTTSSSTLKELLVLDGEISGVSTDDRSGASSEESSKYAVQKAGFEKELSKAELSYSVSAAGPELDSDEYQAHLAALDDSGVSQKPFEVPGSTPETSVEPALELSYNSVDGDGASLSENQIASGETVKKNREKSVKAIKHKKPLEKIEKETVFSKDKNAGREGLLPRKEIMAIINSMREKGSTFDQVAQHLVELGQPTFSGRGDWHAQTIHRLCNKKEEKKQK